MLPAITDTPSIFAEDGNAPVWQQRTMHYRARREAWLDWSGAGVLRLPSGAEVVLGARPDLLTVLNVLRSEPPLPSALYLTAGQYANTRPERHWFRAAEADGWTVRTAPKQHAARLERAGVALDLRQTASFYGDERQLRWVRAAHTRLARDLQARFGPHAALLPTAAQTGRDLLQLSLPSGRRFPVLPPEICELLWHNNTQGRVEVTSLDELRGPLDIWCLDARWMYAACVAHLPSGPAHYDPEFDFLGYTPAFYEIDVRVPADWRHVGLLPFRPEGAEETTFPATPGQRFRTWAWSPEVGLAIDQGWHVAIRRRLYWPEPSSRPLDAWAKKLRELRSGYQFMARDRRDYVAELLTGATRNLLIQTVGTLHRATRYESGVTPEREYRSIPAGATWRQPGDGHIHWLLEEDIRQPWVHPEWSTLVWSRCRARAASRALSFPREALLACRTDAWYLASEPRGIVDDGKPGAWRVKDSWRGVAVPRHNSDIIRLLNIPQDDEEDE